MKYVLGLLLLIIAFAACQKEINGDLPPVDTNIVPLDGVLKADIDGVQWIADKSVKVYVIPPGDSGLTTAVIIQGTGNDKRVLELITEDFQVRNFPIIDTIFNGAGYADTAGVEFTTSNGPAGISAGSIQITAIDTGSKTISGTFSFKVYSDSGNVIHTFSNGSFTKLPYVVSPAGPPANPTDTFRVNVNNIPFVPFSIGAADINMTTLAIAAAGSTNSEGVNLNFNYGITPGTYVFDTTTLSRFNYYRISGDTFRINPAKPGTLTILQNTTPGGRIRGSFSVTVFNNKTPVDSLKLTQGYFSVGY